MTAALSAESLPLLIVAAFFGGALNSLAGGGSFLTLPAVMVAGAPAVIANATGTVALLPGYVSAAAGFREDLREAGAFGLVKLVVLCLIGGAIGAGLLVATPEEAFRAVVPWLLLVATVLFAAGERISRWLRARVAIGAKGSAAGLLCVAIYGGYFNGGLGILLLALFSLFGLTDINQMNGLKSLASVVLTAIAVATYATAGAVWWMAALVMMVSATIGGYAGARIARRLPASFVRATIIVVGAAMTAAFFISAPG